MAPLDIEIMFTPTCPHGRTLRARIDALARSEGIEVAVTETVLDDPADAAARRFRGSPTVLVHGSDIEPQPAGTPADYGLG
jgi:hypothetical protein